MTTILLARHGETDWNREQRWQGHADPPLNDTGRAQARALAERVDRVDAVYVSDLRRAQETAEIVAATLDLPVQNVSGLREIDVGEWSGLTWTEIEQRFPDGVLRHRAGGDGWKAGESHDDMSARVAAAVRTIATAHPDGVVLVVAHGGTIRALLALAEGLGLAEYRQTRAAPPNGSIAAIVVDERGFRVLDEVASSL